MAPDQRLHDTRLEKVCSRMEEWGFHLRFEKCRFAAREVKYLGMIISDKGIQADPSKIEAIRNLRQPKSPSDVRASLGLLNYYGKFSPQMHAIKAPFEALLKKNVVFNWSEVHHEAFIKAKEILTGSLLLAHYDPQYSVIGDPDVVKTCPNVVDKRWVE
ncbi:uncharacterized protein LOC108865221 [Galendromus occidentalis]|uniref:RNA-directed DNA polymerase n=1 Tax=Galendromus occidentalis TaxID=34638 RepID=A0AAJ7L6Q8_9ACAR|nr:uncharacterized protein LOC108865221 [Galendromus occidentalis]